MAKIKIYRSSEWMNRARAIGVYVDGQKRGIISNGGVQEYDIPEGTRTLKTKIDWCGSQDYAFTVSENETKTVMLSSFGYYNHFIQIGAGVLALNLILLLFFKINILTWALFLFLLWGAYYITIGRNNYLIIRDKNLSTSLSNELAEDQSL